MNKEVIGRFWNQVVENTLVGGPIWHLIVKRVISFTIMSSSNEFLWQLRVFKSQYCSSTKGIFEIFEIWDFILLLWDWPYTYSRAIKVTMNHFEYKVIKGADTQT